MLKAKNMKEKKKRKKKGGGEQTSCDRELPRRGSRCATRRRCWHRWWVGRARARRWRRTHTAPFGAGSRRERGVGPHRWGRNPRRRHRSDPNCCCPTPFLQPINGICWDEQALMLIWMSPIGEEESFVETKQGINEWWAVFGDLAKKKLCIVFMRGEVFLAHRLYY